jgi:hypothetical protein
MLDVVVLCSIPNIPMDHDVFNSAKPSFKNQPAFSSRAHGNVSFLAPHERTPPTDRENLQVIPWG